MNRDGGVLTLTDLTASSVHALALAGRIAEQCGLHLDVLYALGLRGLTLERAVPELAALDQRIASIDHLVRTILREQFPHWERAPGPVIDVDSAPVALIRRAAQLLPPVIVLPAEWHGDRERLAGRVSTLTSLSAPVLLTGSSARGGPVVLLASAPRPPAPWLRTAHAWTRWLQAVCGAPDVPGDGAADIVAIQDSGGLPAAHAVMAESPWAVVMQQSMLAGRAGESLSPAVFSLLAQATSHVLIVPDGVEPPARLSGDRGGSRLVSAGV